MMLAIEDSSDQLMTLLWVREAWGLEVRGANLPPLLVDSPEPVDPAVRDRAPLAEWAYYWPELWEGALEHAGQERRPPSFERLQASADGSEERRAALLTLLGPTWQDRFGNDALEQGYHAWRSTRSERDAGSRPMFVDHERANLDVVVPAWEAGLTTIIVLPCVGDVAARIGEHGLFMTETTRADTASYRRAIALFN